MGTSQVGAITKAKKDRSHASSSVKRKLLRIERQKFKYSALLRIKRQMFGKY